MTSGIHSNVVQPPTNTPMFPGGKPPDQLWASFFQALVSAAGPIEPLVVSASPYLYVAVYPGHLFIRGGTISALALTRARVTINPLGLVAGFMPLAPGDQLTVTYSVLPSLWYIPDMGGAGGP